MEPAGPSEVNVQLKFIESSHGGEILIRGGYRYHHKRCNKSGTSVWTCARSICKGSVVLDGNHSKIIRETYHSCVPDFESIDIEQSLIDLKKKVSTDYRPIPQIWKEEMAKYMSEPYADKLPSFYQNRDCLYKHRRAQWAKVNVQSCDDVQLPEELAKDFLCTNKGGILIFITPDSQNNLKNIENFFMDGTFKITPKPYVQLYTVHGDIGSDLEFTKMVPFFFVLLPNKKQRTYEMMFQSIKELVPNFNPKNVKVDFELAAKNALQIVFPSTKITGCYFHFSKAVWTNAGEFGICNSRDGCIYVRKCVQLAHLPNSKIMEGWFGLQAKAPAINNIGTFNEYLEGQWFTFKNIDLLSCYNHRHRTTNVVEGWHSKLNKTIRNDLNLLHFIWTLKEEAISQDFKFSQHELNHDVYRKRARKYIEIDKKIQRIVNAMLVGDITLDRCIDKLSYLKY
ncbi:uncharacterized protein LOC134669686 [Cydia fagiglandana]|uniref:uncharacterized protein LOC134669686 n=1 Tax=Cydia fagiglandana TaxID=1458189 RepID=UPI002FEE096E